MLVGVVGFRDSGVVGASSGGEGARAGGAALGFAWVCGDFSPLSDRARG